MTLSGSEGSVQSIYPDVSYDTFSNENTSNEESSLNGGTPNDSNTEFDYPDTNIERTTSEKIRSYQKCLSPAVIALSRALNGVPQENVYSRHEQAEKYSYEGVGTGFEDAERYEALESDVKKKNPSQIIGGIPLPGMATNQSREALSQAMSNLRKSGL